jgi:ComF family protein
MKIGTLLCDNCKYDITSEPFSMCVSCNKTLAGISGICSGCRVPYERAWCAGQRQDHLQRLIGNFKFTNAKAAYKPLAAILDAILPVLPDNTVIVPIPTVSSHIRERGYDHMLLVARELARRRHLTVSTCLGRATSTKQRDAGYRQRVKQAKEAFSVSGNLDEETIYLMIDDVITTGATMKYAAKTLKAAGAGTVWVASISHQALD